MINSIDHWSLVFKLSRSRGASRKRRRQPHWKVGDGVCTADGSFEKQNPPLAFFILRFEFRNYF
jgi:hypothetical protein